MEYPKFLQDLLNACPNAGSGVHSWLFKVARYLHRYHSPEEICAILESRVADCGRFVEPHEITDAVKNSGACAWEPNPKNASERRAEWLQNPVVSRVPEFKPERALSVAAKIPIEITTSWLKAWSPWPVTYNAIEYNRSIFVPDERVLYFCRYKSQGLLFPEEGNLERFVKHHWPEGAWFLSNPVDGLHHWNPRLQKDSRRSEESVTSFRHAVLECDLEPREKWRPIWLKILVGLELPIISITDSGSKSDHALVRTGCKSKADWDAFKREKLRPLVELGADDGALSAVRLTRLPGCWRGDHLQELLYLNPLADGTPIFPPQ
jgi:hypothetical protein